MSEKLYLISTRGIGEFYVVANDSHQAYEKVKLWYKNNNWGADDGELKSVTLLAENAEYPNCKMRLFL